MKLTAEQRAEIRRLAPTLKHKTIAEHFGIATGYVSNVANDHNAKYQKRQQQKRLRQLEQSVTALKREVETLKKWKNITLVPMAMWYCE